MTLVQVSPNASSLAQLHFQALVRGRLASSLTKGATFQVCTEHQGLARVQVIGLHDRLITLCLCIRILYLLWQGCCCETSHVLYLLQMLHSFTNVLQSCRLQICMQKDIEEPCLLSSLCFLISETGRKGRKLVGSHTVRRASSFAADFPLLCSYLSEDVAFYPMKSPYIWSYFKYFMGFTYPHQCCPQSLEFSCNAAI